VRFPRAVIAASLLLAALGGVLAVRYLAGGPMENDLSNTRNKPVTSESSSRLLTRRVDKVVGRLGQDGVAIMVDRLDQVLPLKVELDKRREAAPEDRKPFQRVVTIFDLLPTDQEKKLELVGEARERLERAHRRGIIGASDWAEIEKNLPRAGMAPLGIDDLPPFVPAEEDATTPAA